MTGPSTPAPRPERLTTHLAAPGARIVPDPGTSRWSSYGRDYCQGDVRALYARDKSKRWERAGWVCTRCGSVELEPGLIGTERDAWHRRQRPDALDVAASYAGQLQNVDRPVSTPSPATVLHPADPDGVDTDVDDDDDDGTPARPWAQNTADPDGVDTDVDAYVHELVGQVVADVAERTGLMPADQFMAAYRGETSPGVDTARRTTTPHKNGRGAVDVARDLEDSIASIRRVRGGAAAAGVDTRGHVEAAASVDTAAIAGGVDTGWDPSALKPCPDCGESISAANLARHRRRVHAVTA